MHLGISKYRCEILNTSAGFQQKKNKKTVHPINALMWCRCVALTYLFVCFRELKRSIRIVVRSISVLK